MNKCPWCSAVLDATLTLVTPGSPLAPPPPPPPPAGGIVISPLVLNKTSLAAGDTLSGTATFTNTSAAPITVQTLQITSRPPGGTNAGGPYYHLAPQLGATTIPPGGAVTLAASRLLMAADPPGAWYAYAVWQETGATGAWHGGPSVGFSVVAAATLPPPSPPPVTPPPSPPPTGTGLIPAARLTTWAPGIPGGIPARTTVFTTLAAGATTPAIQAALDACPVGQVVQLAAGDFNLSGRLELRKGIVLRGMGPAMTKLRVPVGTNDNLITIGTKWFKFTQPTNLAADAVKGSRSVALASNPGLVVGEIVLVDMLTNPSITEWSSKSPPGDASRTWFTRPDRPVGQVMEVESFVGNTITFTTPFHITFDVAHTAQLVRFGNITDGPVIPSVKYAGVEDLYVSGGSGGQGNIELVNAAYCWIKNVESDMQDGAGVAIDGSFRCVLRDSYIHSTQQPYPGGGGYGISFSWYSADNLVENNIVWNMNKVMVMRASGGGNVIGYNYMEDGYIGNQTQWVEVGLNASHMTCPHYELFEGNQSFNFDGDNTWGNAVYITAFRNHLTAKRRSIAPLTLTEVQNVRAIGLMEGHRWYSFVGNVLGLPGQVPPGYVLDAPFPWTDNPVGMWRLGYNPENWNAPPDPNVTGTVIREGNFDYATGQVHWSGAAAALPDSLYLSTKPAFFGTAPWPWVDPLGTTKTATLPARARFDAMPTH